MSIEAGEMHEVDDVAHQQLLQELGFNREQLEEEHEGFAFYYFVDRQLKPEFMRSGQRFVLCEDVGGKPYHFRNGYLYLVVAERPVNRG